MLSASTTPPHLPHSPLHPLPPSSPPSFVPFLLRPLPSVRLPNPSVHPPSYPTPPPVKEEFRHKQKMSVGSGSCPVLRSHTHSPKCVSQALHEGFQNNRSSSFWLARQGRLLCSTCPRQKSCQNRCITSWLAGRHGIPVAYDT